MASEGSFHEGGDNDRSSVSRSPSGGSVVSHRLAWAVLIISLTASAGGWWISRQHELFRVEQRFDKEVDRITMALEERMLIYEDVLHGVVGLYASSYSVERGEWRSYLESVSVHTRFPGIDAVGFVAHVRPEGMEAFLEQTRQDGVTNFVLKNVNPEGPAYLVKYIEPEEQHRSVVGYDMSMDPERRAVADKARNSGKAVMSGRVSSLDNGLVEESVVVMMLPVYRRGAQADTPASRRANVEGWVYARFVPEQLIRAMLGAADLTVAFEIYDGSKMDPEKRLFSNVGASSGADRSVSRFATRRPVTLASRLWTLKFVATPDLERSVSTGKSLFVAVGGGVISLLLFGIAWSLSQTRQRAEALATRMTAALREVNRQLEHERFLLRTLMDNVPDRIYFKDARSRFLRNSKALLEQFGLTDMDQAMGKTDFDFFTAEHARSAFDDERKIMETGEPVTKEERETWPDQPDTWVLSTKMPLRNERGEIVGTFGISRDITDRKRAEEAMRKAKEVAEAANAAKSQFLASMSHELRTPLNSVIGFAGVLLKNKAGNLSATDLNFLERIQANGKHLLALINQVLDLAKIEARKMELELSEVRLDALVRETVAQQEGLVRDRPVRLVADLPSRVAPLRTDASKLKQVLINLIGNALKFTEQGSVTVKVLTESGTDHPVRLEVIDTGIGISRDKLKAVFEAFQQADTGTDRKYGGTGLGLTISRALCGLMGYSLEVSSEPGKGSVFSVVFESVGAAAIEPLVSERQVKDSGDLVSGARAQPGRLDLEGTRVLVIDDEPDARVLLAEMLGEFGCEVIEAKSGEEGLRMAREFRPQMITVDLMMPSLHGADVVRAIRGDPDLRSTPVVVVSVVASESRGRILGDVELLQKPIQREELLTVLRRNLPSNKPRVLVVDDDADARRLLSELLRDEAEVETAADGREALACLGSAMFDLVFLDLMMPVMGGTAFLDALRSDPRHKALPVVVITAKELGADEARRLEQQAQEVLKKTEVFENDLKHTLQRALARTRKAREG